MTIEDVINVESVPQISPGIQLSTERKKRGLTEREVADQLKITLSKLQSIEKDQYDKFQAQIYLRGYLKNYARLLNISEQEIIASYEAHAGPDAVEDDFVPSPDNVPEQRSAKGMFVMVAVAVIVLLVFIFYFQVFGAKDVASKDPTGLLEPAIALGMSEPEVNQPEASLESFPIIVEQKEAEQPLELIDESLNVTDSQAPDVQKAEDEPVEMLASKLTAVELINLSTPKVEESVPALEVVNPYDVLAFRFDNQCWIEVRDNSGILLYSGLENAGSVRQIEGEAPFKIVIGNVEGTVLSLNGEGVALQAPTDGRPLRLQVGS